MVRLKMSETLTEAATYIEQGHVRVGPHAVTDPAVRQQVFECVLWGVLKLLLTVVVQKMDCPGPQGVSKFCVDGMRREIWRASNEGRLTQQEGSCSRIRTTIHDTRMEMEVPADPPAGLWVFVDPTCWCVAGSCGEY